MSDQELLAVLLGKGAPGMDVMKLAARLAKVIDTKGLGVQADDLREFAGVGDAKASLVLAALEFARRRIKPEGARIESPADLLPHVRHYADRKQVFADALADRASGIIVAHNHPAGSLEPSPADIESTRQLRSAGGVLGIPLLDHIIFNRTGYFSFLEAGRL